MRRNSGVDEGIRELARQVRAGDDKAAVQLARVLVRSGVVPTGHPYAYTLAPLLSYPAALDGGPDLCIVPINRSVIHVQIGPAQARNGVSRATTHDTTIPLPGVASEHGTTGPGVGQHGYFVTYRACADSMRGVGYGTRTRAYGLVGYAIYVVDHENMSVTCVSRHGRPVLAFSADNARRPSGHEAVRAQAERELVGRLTPFMARWVTENPQALAAAERDVGLSDVGKAMKRYEDAEAEADSRRRELAAVVIERLNVMGI